MPPHPAGVRPPGADGVELPGRRRRLATPAGDGVVPLQPAVVVPPGADGGELPGRRRRLTTSTFQPQQATEPSRFTPQVWPTPALTEANCPA